MTSKWTQERNDLLIRNWSQLSIAALQELLGCGDTTIYRRVNYLRSLGFLLPKKTGSISQDQPQPKTAPPKQTPASQPVQEWHGNWINSAAYRARLMGGR